ncbi:MAG: hypothetical protein LIO80_05315, partial [Lachnospiraceae bacterium]|nr:hypothetical protein [Lachnospiraceae bacterium]
MPSNEEKQITKENLDAHLYMLAKEIKKSYHPKSTIEIVMVGGAAILANYTFRASTYDIDALMQETSIVKEAGNRVADKFNLPTGWVNSD